VIKIKLYRLEQVHFPTEKIISSILSIKTRPDLVYSVGYASRFIENFPMIIIVKRILKYLKRSINQEIAYKTEADENSIHVYTDSDFAGDFETRRNTTCFIYFIYFLKYFMEMDQ